jgi:serine/threonine protein kinase
VSSDPQPSVVVEESASAELEPGDVVGSYRIVERLAVGGMGIVYVGRHLKLRREVAIKALKPRLAMQAREARRFLEEARAVSELRHPRIVEIHDFVEDFEREPPLIYMVMELLRGRTLSDEIAARGALPPNEAITIGCQIAEGLEAVHRIGLLHRDLKASNVFLAESVDPPDVKLLDFGLTVPLSGRESDLTDPGKILGTPEYMSPEQFRGEPLDVRSDIYMLGVVLYEMLAGARPFAGRALVELMIAQVREQPPPIRVRRPIALELEAIVMRCLEKQPDGRYPSVAALREVLAASLADTRDLGRELGLGPPFAAPAARRRGLLAAGVASGLLLAGAGALLSILYLRGPEPTQPPPSPALRSAADARPAAASQPASTPSPAPRADAGVETLPPTTVKKSRKPKKPGPRPGLTVDPWKL